MSDSRSPIGKGSEEEAKCSGLREWSLKGLRCESESPFIVIARRSWTLE